MNTAISTSVNMVGASGNVHMQWVHVHTITYTIVSDYDILWYCSGVAPVISNMDYRHHHLIRRDRWQTMAVLRSCSACSGLWRASLDMHVSHGFDFIYKLLRFTVTDEAKDADECM